MGNCIAETEDVGMRGISKQAVGANADNIDDGTLAALLGQSPASGLK